MTYKSKGLKFIGDSVACAWRLPFAKNKLNKLIKSLNKSTSSKSYTFPDGALIEITAAQRSNSITITAGGSGYIFAGANRDSVLQTFEVSGNESEKASIDTPFTAPFPSDAYHAMVLDVPRFDWSNADSSYTVVGGVGSRYGIGIIDNPLNQIRDAYLQDLIPEVLYPNGRIFAVGAVGSECIIASLFNGYVLGVDKFGVLKSWPIDNPADITVTSLPLPSWVGQSFTAHLSTGSVNIQQGLGLGDCGIQWNFNKAGNAIVGGITAYTEYLNEDNTHLADLALPAHVKVELNPEVTNGVLTVSPVLTEYQIIDTSILSDWDYITDSVVFGLVKTKKYRNNDTDYTGLVNGQAGDMYQVFSIHGILASNAELFSFNIYAKRYHTYYEDNPPAGYDPAEEGETVLHNSVTGIDLRYNSTTENCISSTIEMTTHEKSRSSYLAGKSYPFGQLVKHDSFTFANQEEKDYMEYLQSLTGGVSATPMTRVLYDAIALVVRRNYWVESSINCKVDEVKSTFKLATMQGYDNNAGLVNFLDVIDINGTTLTHEEVYTALGYVSGTQDKYKYSTFCLYNLFTG